MVLQKDNKKILLVDMDNVIADFDGYIVQKLGIKTKHRGNFYIELDYPQDQEYIRKIYTSKGFFENLVAIEGSIEALKKLERTFDIYICTSPLLRNPHCIDEKFKWVENNLGKDWAEKIIITKNKKIISGEYLIDDKPMTQEDIGTWKLINLEKDYNAKSNHTFRGNWEEILDYLLN